MGDLSLMVSVWHRKPLQRRFCVLFFYAVLTCSLAETTSGGSHGSTSRVKKVEASWHNLDLMCHLAELLQFVAFMQHNMLKLRALEMCSAVLLGTYSFLHTWKATDCHFMWAILHFLINFYHVAMYFQRYCGTLSDDERKLLSGFFHIYDRAEFAELKRHSAWVDYNEGEFLMEAHEDVDRLLLLANGQAQVIAADKLNPKVVKELDADLDGPQFLGELAFFTNETPHVSVRAVSGNVRCLAWDMTKVRELAHSSGHSLEKVAFRQLPSLMARQAANRVKQLTLKTTSRHTLVSGREEIEALKEQLRRLSRSNPTIPDELGIPDHPTTICVASTLSSLTPRIAQTDLTHDNDSVVLLSASAMVEDNFIDDSLDSVCEKRVFVKSIPRGCFEGIEVIATEESGDVMLPGAAQP